MFETFLNATVRGKELGQFFTPRPVVKYMTKTAGLKVKNRKLPRLIDACCGSGGFLIEALAQMTYAIKKSSQLTNAEVEEFLQKLKRDHLYGIEANDEIGRVARLNMYLHGDGGSRIYVADSLDKELVEESGLLHERQQQLNELRQQIIDNRLRFDFALTNPPFSMSYSKKSVEESRVLNQYEISQGETAHSNVLFLERYRDLLTPEGELLTVIDDTVLNGISAKKYRQFLFDNFIIRQVVSLPFNTFFRAQANIKTSMLHLRRKADGEEQGDVFMAITNNVGHDDHKHETPHRNNLDEVANRYVDWDENGREPHLIKENEGEEPLGCPLQVFVVPADKLSEQRLDAFYYAPELMQMREDLQRLALEGELTLKRGSDFELGKRLSSSEKSNLRGRICKYIEITSVTRDGAIISPIEKPFEDLPKRAELKLTPNDVLFAKNNSSRGTTVVVPEWLDGGIASTGFINVRAGDEEEALILWTIFRSEVWRKQVYYLAITASQPEVRDKIFKEEMLIPWPNSLERRNSILSSARNIMRAREQERVAIDANRSIYDDFVGLEER